MNCIMGEKADCEFNSNGCNRPDRAKTLFCPPLCNVCDGYRQQSKKMRCGTNLKVS
jgi:hypothetical protein